MGEPERLLAGRYRLLAVLGKGGMGAVWRARDELLKRDVAVKEIIWPPQMDPDERETARLRAVREAQMAARLRHPNIVGIYDFFEEDGRPCIVMELVPYRSLRDAVRADGPLSAADAARVGLGVLAALAAVHEVGVVHRDVKPANILLGPEGRVVLTDFGIAKAADSPTLTKSGVLIGSASYIAPERALGGQASAAADLWALGASLYAAVEGRPPFDRDGVLASLTAVVADEPDPPSHSGPLWPVISGLLRKDPAARLAAAEAGQLLSRIAEKHDAAPVLPAPGQDVEPAVDLTSQDVRPGPDSIATVESDQAMAHWEETEPAVAAGPIAAEPIAAEPIAAEPIAAEPIAAEPMAAEGTSSYAGPDAGQAPDLPAQPARRSRPGGVRRYRAASAAAAVLMVAIITGIGLVLARAPGRQPAPHSAAATQPTVSASASVPTATASPSGSSTSSPAASGGSGSSAVPAGYFRFTNSTGFSIGVPTGWQISHDGHYVYIRDPDDAAIFLLIDQSDQPQANPLADWQQQAAARESTYPGYHLIRLQAVSYAQAEKAADWEFTYDRDGDAVQVLNRNVLANARHAYALYWSTPVSDWNEYYHFFQVFAATFRPASVSQAG
jgi:eukaryotic-like serine/threonine-protein kinase